MKTEKDDMPEYLRNRKKPGPWRFVAIMGVGSAIFWAAAMMFAKPIAVDIDQIKKGIHVAGTPWFNQEQKQLGEQAKSQPYRAVATVPTPTPTRATAQRELSQSEIEWFEQASKEAEARRQESRQTSFNDQNYQRRGAVNSIPPPGQHVAYAQPERASRRQTTRITHTANWSWESGHAKNRTGGRFQWTEVNGAIDWSSVCSNYQSGSIEYRDCRKGAKVAFRRICNQNQAACAAENNYMP